jgi:hypothetical protein
LIEEHNPVDQLKPRVFFTSLLEGNTITRLATPPTGGYSETRSAVPFYHRSRARFRKASQNSSPANTSRSNLKILSHFASKQSARNLQNIDF